MPKVTPSLSWALCSHLHAESHHNPLFSCRLPHRLVPSCRLGVVVKEYEEALLGHKDRKQITA